MKRAGKRRRFFSFRTATRRNRTARTKQVIEGTAASQVKRVLAMRTLLIPVALATILSTSALALAAAQHTDGIVRTYDSKTMTLTLVDGSVYSMPENFKGPNLRPGEKVQIS
jgi:hypothetical protein